MKNNIPVRTFVPFAVGIALGIIMSVLVSMLLEQGQDTQTCMDYSASRFVGVKFGDVQEDVRRYGGTHVPAIKTSMKNALIDTLKQPSRSCTFPLDTIKKFIYYLEKHAAHNQVPTDNLAIRFYYGVYPQTMTGKDGKEYGSLHTLFLVPTRYDSSKHDYIDYDPIGNRSISYLDYNFIAFIVRTPELRRSVKSLPPLTPNPQPMGKNQGGLCPPGICDETLLSRTEAY